MPTQEFFQIMHSDKSRNLMKDTAKFVIDNYIDDLVPYGYASRLIHTAASDAAINEKITASEPFVKLIALFDGVEPPYGYKDDIVNYLRYQVWVEINNLWSEVDSALKDQIQILADTTVDARPGYDFLKRLDGIHNYEPTAENRSKMIDYINMMPISNTCRRLANAVNNRETTFNHCAFSLDSTAEDIIENVDQFAKCFKEWLDGITAKYTIESIYTEFVVKTVRWDNQFAIFAKNQFDIETALKARDMCQEIQEQLFDLDTMVVAFDTSDPKYSNMLDRMAGVVESIYNSDAIFDDVCCIRQALVEMCKDEKSDKHADNKEE